MREIKFRAWNGELLSVFDDIMNITLGETIVHFQDKETEAAFAYDSVILMQYTGLKDKNGKSIYEGDILDLHSTVNGVNLFEVYYNEPQARFSIKYYTSRMQERGLEYEYSVSDFFKPCEFSGEVDFEIIGNIYENPELLEDV